MTYFVICAAGFVAEGRWWHTRSDAEARALLMDEEAPICGGHSVWPQRRTPDFWTPKVIVCNCGCGATKANDGISH